MYVKSFRERNFKNFGRKIWKFKQKSLTLHRQNRHSRRLGLPNEDKNTKMKDRIERIRRHYGMMQNEFAKAIGISAPSLSSIINGRTSPTNNTVQAIHRRFPEVSITWLMFGEGEMMTTESSEPTTSELDFQGDSDRHTESPEMTNSDEERGAETTAKTHPHEVVALQDIMKFIDKPKRKITEIHVFFDDGTFETFVGRRED